MAHTFQHKPYTFIYNPDLSGSVEIINSDGKKFYVTGSALRGFLADYIRNKRIEELEALTDQELLG